MKFFDTIAAISTPVGTGGVAIIRISGEDSVQITSDMVLAYNKKNLSEFESHKLCLSTIKTADEKSVIDEALVTVMHAPNSFTGETVVEIQCHGGYIVAKRILTEVIKQGARLAEPGEFTRRAFINGKCDLVRAEASADLIHASSYLGAENSAKAITGRLSEKINFLRDMALSLASHISASADYPDEVDDLSQNEILEKTEKLDIEIDKLLAGFDTGKMLREGIHTVIIGRPNVGKSSVLNALLKEEKAIVTDIPGTTRDIVEDFVNLNGITLRIMDTAGIRQEADIVEQIGIDKAYQNSEIADLCLFVVDSSSSISKEDTDIFDRIRNKKYIIISNKTDLNPEITKEEIAENFSADKKYIVFTSVPKNGEIQIDELEDKISEMFLEKGFNTSEVYITCERQRNALIRAKESVNNIKSVANGLFMQDLLYVDLEDIISALGEITGETVQDEIIDNVFKNFCVGK